MSTKSVKNSLIISSELCAAESKVTDEKSGSGCCRFISGSGATIDESGEDSEAGDDDVDEKEFWDGVADGRVENGRRKLVFGVEDDSDDEEGFEK
jgi:hypothetical protein